jgi:hypothetical protein
MQVRFLSGAAYDRLTIFVWPAGHFHFHSFPDYDIIKYLTVKKGFQVMSKNSIRTRAENSGLGTFARKHERAFEVLLLFLAVTLTVGLSLVLRVVRKEDRTPAKSTEETTQQSTALVRSTNQALNDLFREYYDAMAAGDTDTIESISSELSAEEKIRITEIAKYIESYPTITVYTKSMPDGTSYVCYVYTTMKFEDHDWEVPGLQTMYVCERDDGSYYINNSQDQDESVTEYIQKVSLEEDVVDLSNQTTKEYNDLVQNNSELASYLNELSSNIDLSVGQQLGALQTGSTLSSTEETTETAEAAGESAAQETAGEE